MKRCRVGFSLAVWLLFAGTLLAGPGCSKGEKMGLLLAQAEFSEDHETMPARLLILRPITKGGEEVWEPQVLVDDKSDVFHKALPFKSAAGKKGILTIGANGARFLFWSLDGDSYKPETIWEGTVGDGKGNRLRDMEIGDVTGDGVDDIVIVTHNRGIVFVVEQKGGKLEVREIDRAEEETWIHEVELGDVDGDGVLEIFATPSAANVTTGKEQPGDIVMYRRDGKDFKRSIVEHFPGRHAKEILFCDFEGDGSPTLFAAIEGEKIGSASGASSKLRVYRWKDGVPIGEDVIQLSGKLCRFLCMGDTDGDRIPEIVASTYSNGIYSVWRENGKWTKRRVMRPGVSSSFEHATILYDWGGDGRDDLFVASDLQGKVQRIFYDAKGDVYKKEVLFDMEKKSNFTFNINLLPLDR